MMDNDQKCSVLIRLFFLLVFIGFIPQAIAGYNEGQTAFDNGDYAKALRLWQQVIDADENGVAGVDSSNEQIRDAEYGIGLIYWYGGGGIKQDYKKAAEWFNQSAEAGHADAQLILGYILYQGVAGDKNERLARKWLQAAAEAGLIVAQYNLAQFYFKGIGGVRDQEQGIYWLNQAVEQGDVKSEKLLQLVQAGSIPGLQDETRYQIEPETAAIADKVQSQKSVLNGPAWLLSQDKNHYAVQVIAMYTLESIESIADAYSEKGAWAYYAKQKNGKKIYILYLCCLKDQATAQRRQLELNAALKGYETFPVKLEKLQAHINAARE